MLRSHDAGNMAMKTLITNELFLDFIICRYRGYLKITGATEPKSDLLDVSGRLRERYHSQAREHLLRAYRDEGKQVCTDVRLSVVLANRYDLAIDVTATDTNASVRLDALIDRKSTRLNSSHLGISYAVFR